MKTNRLIQRLILEESGGEVLEYALIAGLIVVAAIAAIRIVGTKVLARRPGGKTARVDIDYHGVRAHFTTNNVNRVPESIMITLHDGPFRDLQGEWRFHALAEAACKVEFELAYEFATPLLGTVFGPVFSHIANTFIDAFVRRAEAVYATQA